MYFLNTFQFKCVSFLAYNPFDSVDVKGFYVFDLSKSHRAGACSDGFNDPTDWFNRFGGAGIGLGSLARI